MIITGDAQKKVFSCVFPHEIDDVGWRICGPLSLSACPHLGLVASLQLQVCGRGALDRSASCVPQDHDHPVSVSAPSDTSPNDIYSTSIGSWCKRRHILSHLVAFLNCKLVSPSIRVGSDYVSPSITIYAKPMPTKMCQGSWCQVPQCRTPSCPRRCPQRGCRCCPHCAGRRCRQAWHQTPSPAELGSRRSQQWRPTVLVLPSPMPSSCHW